METQQQHKIAPEFVKNIDGKDFVVYAGLLDKAHNIGINQLQVEAIQLPMEENNYTAVCKASCYGKDGKVFIEVGDANPSNCNSKVAKHIIRMAATRAKARALRDYTNIGMTCLEELGDNDDILADRAYPKQRPARKNDDIFPDRPGPPSRPEEEPTKNYRRDESRYAGRSDSDAPPMSDAQRRAIYTICKRKGMNEAAIRDYVRDYFEGEQVTFEELTVPQASKIIGSFERKAA